MLDDVRLRYILKQKAEQYNKDQKSLYFNKYILKTVLLLIIIFMLFFIFFLFVLPVLTPLFLKKSIISDAIAISFSGCLFSLVVIVLLIIFFYRRKKKKEDNKLAEYDEMLLDIHYAVANTTEEKPYNSGTNVEIPFDDKSIPKSITKKGRISKYKSLISSVKDLVKLVISELFTMVEPPGLIYFDNNKLNFSIELIKDLINIQNNLIQLTVVLSKYTDYSNKWVLNVINELVTLKILTVAENNNEEKILLINSDFYDPETNQNTES